MADGGASGVHQFNTIYLGGRGGLNPGQLKIHPTGFLWRKTGGGKVVEVAKNDVAGVYWMKIPKGNQLSVRRKAGAKIKFNGFRDQDVTSLSGYFSNHFGIQVEERHMATSGRNWGDVEIEGNMLAFKVNNQLAFEVSIADDISQTQPQGKNDVVLEFHVDDTAGAGEKDTLMEMSFHIPNSNKAFSGDEERSAAQVFYERLLERADVGPAQGEAVATFQEVKCSLKAEEGQLYPLEKSFFFVPKPPTLILHEEIQYVEFERHGVTGTSGISSHYFDLLIVLKNDTQHQFRNIQRIEYHNLFNFINTKGLRIMNLTGEQGGPVVDRGLGDGVEDEGHDPHLARILKSREGGRPIEEVEGTSDEEDSDFAPAGDNDSASEQSSGEHSNPSEDSDSGDEDEMEEEDDEGARPKKSKDKGKDHEGDDKRASTSKGASAVPTKRKKADGEDGGKKKGVKKKKDPNAPKRALSGYMFFCKEEREATRKENPLISFAEIGKAIGEKWQSMSKEEKAPYEAMSRKDRERYEMEKAAYGEGGGVGGGGGGGEAGAGDDGSDED
ncbi:hypothetical protein CBR_g20179 [Chara braunii]|uniref:FACT complex subunit SSRP1 n=1 Tax=Chara braunii TaxID=69332 RepID=A0A388KZV7_CHABU|nr:hypothetical protein CBR_g20179 [Chara braunii]|eukprot:GBG75548.1 hypothetical protein CBR_g20179 [Chara braunii]